MAAPGPAAVSCTEITDAGTAVPPLDTFAPSLWGDFFVNYVPPPTQRSEKWMRDRAEELKRQVLRMLEDGESMGVAKAVELVDTIERLGLDSHFREEIATTISLIHGAGANFAGSDDLHVAATRFRLLRQHGLWVPTDVLDKFRDGEGKFSAAVSGNPRAVLSLYHAAHMAVPGEATLDDAISFARRYLELEAAKGELRSPVAEQASRALDHPLPRYTKQLEAMHCMAEYPHEETHNAALLQLARLHANIMRCLHLTELKAVTLWWKDLYDTMNLKYTRDRAVEVYFWCCGMIPEEDQWRARLMFLKAFGLVSIHDDIFDVRDSIQECRSFDEAIQRWDESAVSIIPEHLRMAYIKMLSNFQEFDDLLGPHEKFRIAYTKREYQRQSKYHLKEAEWTHNKYEPSFEEHEELSSLSTGLPMLILAGLTGYHASVATKELFDWTSAVPDVVSACSKIGRFLNDISSYKLGKNKEDVISAVECYMMEKGVTGEEAVAAMSAKTEENWRVVNRAFIEVDRAFLPVAQLAASIAATCEVMYLRGRDGYTFGHHAQELVTAFFLVPIPL